MIKYCGGNPESSVMHRINSTGLSLRKGYETIMEKEDRPSGERVRRIYEQHGRESRKAKYVREAQFFQVQYTAGLAVETNK